eukprot:582895-Rhodomonas_salina.1
MSGTDVRGAGVPGESASYQEGVEAMASALPIAVQSLLLLQVQTPPAPATDVAYAVLYLLRTLPGTDLAARFSLRACWVLASPTHFNKDHARALSPALHLALLQSSGWSEWGSALTLCWRVQSDREKMEQTWVPKQQLEEVEAEAARLREELEQEKRKSVEVKVEFKEEKRRLEESLAAAEQVGAWRARGEG